MMVRQYLQVFHKLGSRACYAPGKLPKHLQPNHFTQEQADILKNTIDTVTKEFKEFQYLKTGSDLSCSRPRIWTAIKMRLPSSFAKFSVPEIQGYWNVNKMEFMWNTHTGAQITQSSKLVKAIYFKLGLPHQTVTDRRAAAEHEIGSIGNVALEACTHDALTHSRRSVETAYHRPHLSQDRARTSAIACWHGQTDAEARFHKTSLTFDDRRPRHNPQGSGTECQADSQQIASGTECQADSQQTAVDHDGDPHGEDFEYDEQYEDDVLEEDQDSSTSMHEKILDAPHRQESFGISMDDESEGHPASPPPENSSEPTHPREIKSNDREETPCDVGTEEPSSTSTPRKRKRRSRPLIHGPRKTPKATPSPKTRSRVEWTAEDRHNLRAGVAAQAEKLQSGKKMDWKSILLSYEFSPGIDNKKLKVNAAQPI